jgi:hypothetical protein
LYACATLPKSASASPPHRISWRSRCILHHSSASTLLAIDHRISLSSPPRAAASTVLAPRPVLLYTCIDRSRFTVPSNRPIVHPFCTLLAIDRTFCLHRPIARRRRRLSLHFYHVTASFFTLLPIDQPCFPFSIYLSAAASARPLHQSTTSLRLSIDDPP